jgi:drug/metabolite transporter (DMT)-like permease
MSSSSSRPLGIAGLLFATSAWASLFLVGKPVLGHVHPLWFTSIRYGVASAAFAALLLARGSFPWAKLRQHAPRLALYGFAGYGLFGTLVLLGLAHSLPSHGAVVMATMPITTQFVRWAADGVKPTRAAVLGSALALVGVLMVSGVFVADAAQAPSTLGGDLLALLGTLCWIGYTRAGARLTSLDVVEYSGLTALASWPLLLLAAALGAALHWAPAPSAADLAQSWHALLYIGIVPTVLAVLAYNAGVRTLGVVPSGAFHNFVPVSALLMGAALGDRPAPHELFGVALVVAALLIHTLAQQAQQPSARATPQRASARPCTAAR